MNQLYIFNPDHDLALASDSDHFDAPLSAKQFATDFSLLPLWYAEKYSCIWAERVDVEWFESMKKLFPQFKDYRIVSSYEDVDAIRPWGWNKTIRRTLEKHSVAHLPTVAQLDALRELQHRKLSIEATSYLQSIQSDTLRLAKPAQLLSSNEIAQFVENHPFAIFKAPWSGSGKGIIRSLGSLSENLRNRAKNIASRQVGIIAEPLYTVVQDFAMEFRCENGQTRFAGYSLFFSNEHGAYVGNWLATDVQIAERLSRWITQSDLLRIQEKLTDFLNKRVAPLYSGILGVDMFVYQQDNEYFVHPCVEINLRMTMGMVARTFYDTFVEMGKTGTYLVEFHKDSGEISQDLQSSLVVKNGKIQNGCLFLTPSNANTHYCARVVID
ncbi:MAG: hypothetical protein II663_08180 [Bacteroidales bacterium]|nr:hypothetical protein [Bacteroidales bacterium]